MSLVYISSRKQSLFCNYCFNKVIDYISYYYIINFFFNNYDPIVDNYHIIKAHLLTVVGAYASSTGSYALSTVTSSTVK